MMDMMSMRSDTCAQRRTRRASTSALAFAALLVASSCGGSDEPAAEAAATTTEPTTTTTSAPTTVPQTTTTTPEPTTTPAPTTTRPTTTTVAPTTTEPIVVTVPPTTTTTVVVQMPDEPIAPPADSYTQEPIIEVGSIVIPKIGVDMTMYEGIRLTTLDYGPGHWPGTAMPGQTGNVVVGGHRTSSHRVFRDVDQLVAGDEIIYRDAAGQHTYHVDRVEIVDPTAVWIVNPTETATTTLFACHPPGSTAQRIVVFADLVDTTNA